MIVDDHAGTREMIRKFLALPGLTIHECASGEEAVACAREFKPHWVTMDVKLPGLDGFESTKALRKEYPDARILMVTAYDDVQFRRLSQSVGAVGFILKENILALRLMLENEMNHAKPRLSATDDFAPSAQ